MTEIKTTTKPVETEYPVIKAISNIVVAVVVVLGFLAAIVLGISISESNRNRRYYW